MNFAPVLALPPKAPKTSAVNLVFNMASMGDVGVDASDKKQKEQPKGGSSSAPSGG